MQVVEAQGGGMNVSLVPVFACTLAASEYRLPDYQHWFDGAKAIREQQTLDLWPATRGKVWRVRTSLTEI